MRTRLLRWSTVITGGILFGGLGGSCLPDNLLVNTIGDIVGDVLTTLITGQLAGFGLT